MDLLELTRANEDPAKSGFLIQAKNELDETNTPVCLYDIDIENGIKMC